MKKKIVTVLLAGAVVIAGLVGCGNTTEEYRISPIPTEELQATETPVPEVEPTAVPTETQAPTETPTETSEVTVTPAAEPIVTLGQYKGLTLYEVESSAVAAELMAMREEYGEYVTVNHAAEEGDLVNINYVGKKDGVAFEGGTDDSEEGYNLVLGSDSFIDGFEDGLIGAVAGEVRDLNLTFPEDYGKEELDGQEVVFTVTVNVVQEWTVPELTDAFVAENLGYETLADLIMDVYDYLNQESFYEQITNALMESCQVENYPMDRVEAEKQSMIDYYTSYAEYYGAYYGMDAETFLTYGFGFESTDALVAFAEEYAYEIIKNELVMEEIFSTELTEEVYQERLQQYIEWYETDEESFMAEYGGEDYVRLQIQTELVLEYIISLATIVEAEGEVNMEQVQ